jgi:hypothetical protein
VTMWATTAVIDWWSARRAKEDSSGDSGG